MPPRKHPARITAKGIGAAGRNGMQRPRYSRILFFKLGALGDTLMTTPLVRQARRRFPHATLHYLIGRHSAPALEGNPHLDQVITFEEGVFTRKSIVGILRLIHAIRRERYDMIFVLDKHRVFNIIAYLAGIPERIGFDRLGKEGALLTRKAYYGNDKHEIYYYLDLLAQLGKKIAFSNSRIELFLSKTDRAFAKKQWKKHALERKTVIGIAPGGGKNPGETTELRNWPVERYAQLVKALYARHPGHSIVLFGSKEDFEKERALLRINKGSLSGKNIVSFIGACTLKQTAALMERCSCVVCNDAGAMHIAAAANARVISIFGPTNPLRKAPLNKGSVALWNDQASYDPRYELFGVKPKMGKQGFAWHILVDDVLRHIP